MTRRYHMHLPGVVFCGLMLLVAMAAMNSQNNLLFWVFGLMCSAMVISGVLSGVMMLGLRFKRLDPAFGAVGEPLLIRYALTNRSRWLPAFNIHIDEQPLKAPVGNAIWWQHLMDAVAAWIMHAGPRETVHGEAVFWPTQRGEAGFDRARLWTTFPFGIVKKSITFSQPQHTLIYPRMYELRGDVLRAIAPPAPVGARTTERPGNGDEYFGLREHRMGDSVRDIAWKRSAHLDQLVCVDRSMPSPPKLRIVLDLTKPTDELRVGDSPTIPARELEERAISLAASIAHAAYHDGMEFSLIVLGVDIAPIAMRRSFWHLHRIMGALAAINLDAARQPMRRLPAFDAERAGLVIVHPNRVEPLPIRAEALHFTGRQLDALAVRPIGWGGPSSSIRDSSQSVESSGGAVPEGAAA